MTSTMDAPCATGMPGAISSSEMGGNEGSDIGVEGAEKDARGMSSADNGINDSGGEDKGAPVIERVVTPVDGSFDSGGSSDGEKRRPCCLNGTARCFSPGCHLRTPPLALTLARRARDTALRPMDTNPSRGLTPFDLVPVL